MAYVKNTCTARKTTGGYGIGCVRQTRRSKKIALTLVAFGAVSMFAPAYATSKLDLLDQQVFSKRSISASRSDYEGPVAAGGDIVFEDFRVDGDITAGGQVSFVRGQTSGMVNAAMPRLTHVFSSGVGRLPDLAMELAATKLDLLGARLAGLKTTSRFTARNTEHGKREFRAIAMHQREVVDIDGDDLATGDDKTELALEGNADAQIVVRIHGRDVHLRRLGFSISGGLTPSRIAFFFPEAKALEIYSSGGAVDVEGRDLNIPGSIVAPSADLRFTASTVTGQVFAGSIDSIPGLPSGQADRFPVTTGLTGSFAASEVLRSLLNDEYFPTFSLPIEDELPQQQSTGCHLVCPIRSTDNQQ